MAKEKVQPVEKVQFNIKFNKDDMRKIRIYCAENNLKINKMIINAIEKTYNI